MGALFGKAPKPTPVQRMPDANSQAVLEAERRKRMEIANRQGRTSTILSRRGSGTSGAAGTTAYTNSLLGSV